MRINRDPAMPLSRRGDRTLESCPPTRTATRVERVSAPAEATNTPRRFMCESAAKSSVATCVLSPSSNSSTVTKMDQSLIMVVLLSGYEIRREHGIPDRRIARMNAVLAQYTAQSPQEHRP